MVSYIYPDRFQDKPFIRREIATNDHCILIDELVAGRIVNQTRSHGKSVWFWTVTGPYIPSELLPTNGEAETLEEAQEALKVKFLQWQAWAVAQGKDALWHA
jgi:hypothetical protein